MTALLSLLITVSAIYSHEVSDGGLYKQCHYTIPGGSYVMTIRVHSVCPRVMQVEI